jgi:DNA-binding transcriptional LysR family regulator
VIAAVRDAEESVRRSDDAVRGALRVSAPPINSAETFGAMIADFVPRYPDVRLELDLTTRHVDLVAAGATTWPSARRRSSRRGSSRATSPRSRLVVVASPAYLARRGTPRRVAELAKHACLVGFALGEHPATHWPLVRGGRVRVEALMATNDLGVLRASALGATGVALLPLPLVYDDVERGEAGGGAARAPRRRDAARGGVPEREFVPPAVRAFVDAVVAWAKQAPELTRKMPTCDEHAKKAKKAPKNEEDEGVIH